MELLYSILLALAAFWLGACPFSVWIGKRLAGKDIRNYGDGNPGAVNVFRSSGAKLGALALILDIAKGAPFVALAHLAFKLPLPAVLVTGLCAIVGHAYSPFLGMKGGKALAVTAGVLAALPQIDILIVMLAVALLGFLLVESDTWKVMFAPPVAILYLLFTRGLTWEVPFVFLVLVIWVLKQYDELHHAPRIKARPVAWFRSWRTSHASQRHQE